MKKTETTPSIPSIDDWVKENPKANDLGFAIYERLTNYGVSWSQKNDLLRGILEEIQKFVSSESLPQSGSIDDEIESELNRLIATTFEQSFFATSDNETLRQGMLDREGAARRWFRAGAKAALTLTTESETEPVANPNTFIGSASWSEMKDRIAELETEASAAWKQVDGLRERITELEAELAKFRTVSK